jgi:hypothetical protein
MTARAGREAIQEELLVIACAPIATGEDSADRGERPWVFAPALPSNRRGCCLATKQVALVDVAATAT